MVFAPLPVSARQFIHRLTEPRSVLDAAETLEITGELQLEHRAQCGARHILLCLTGCAPLDTLLNLTHIVCSWLLSAAVRPALGVAVSVPGTLSAFMESTFYRAVSSVHGNSNRAVTKYEKR